jgi:hypothetical protein
VVAKKLGFECMSTDGLARHPGRPWRTPDWEVPAHVAEHYGSLTVGELITSVLGHYDRLWPGIEELITAHATEDRGGRGLVVEGSALWPVRVARLEVPRMAAVWLTLDDSVVRARVRAAGCYEAATGEEQVLMDKFLARTERSRLSDVRRSADQYHSYITHTDDPTDPSGTMPAVGGDRSCSMPVAGTRGGGRRGVRSGCAGVCIGGARKGCARPPTGSSPSRSHGRPLAWR